MISWIKGELIDSWQNNNKFFVILNCQGIGYEIQIIESIFHEVNFNSVSKKDIILWIKHIKKEDSDLLFGFNSKDQREFFTELINIRGIGSQIGISLLNKLSLNEIINAVRTNDKKKISSIQGIGLKMTERIILELKNKLDNKQYQKEEIEKNKFYNINEDLQSILIDVEVALESLNYPKKDIKKIYEILINKIKNKNMSSKENIDLSFENLLKEAMHYLDNKSSNLVQLHSKI